MRYNGGNEGFKEGLTQNRRTWRRTGITTLPADGLGGAFIGQSG